MARLKASRQAKLYRTKWGENNPSPPEVTLNRLRSNLTSQGFPLKGRKGGFMILKLQPESTDKLIWGGPLYNLHIKNY